MRMRVRGLAMLAAGFLALGAASPALAQSDDQEQLARQMTHVMLQAVDFDSLIADGAQKSFAGSDFMKVRPEWSPLLVTALREEVAADRPQIEGLVAHAIAGAFTADELRAGIVILNAPEMRAIISAAVKHEPAPAMGNPPCAKDCMAALTSSAGRSFGAKAGNLANVLTGDLQRRVTVIILPGFVVRFGEKAKAYDQAHPLP